MATPSVSILLLDDSEDDRSFCISILEELTGRIYQIEEVDNAQTALSKIVKHNYDCVLLDYNLPGHNGIWLVRELRIRNILVPIIMLTGGGSEQVAVEALKSGVQDYIPKLEITPDALSSAIDHAIKNMHTELETLRLVNYDSLTGLYNRHSFFSRLDSALQRADRFKHQVGLLFLDLDKFKIINDTFGHSAGDEFLVRIGNLLKSCGRDYDTIARLGGDEFVIIVDQLEEDGINSCKTMAKRILDQVSQQEFEIEGQVIKISISIGICIYPALCQDRRKLVEKADLAMYRAKHEGENYIAICDKD